MKPLSAVCNILTVLCFTSCTERDRTRADLIVINGAEVGTIDPALCSAQTEGRIVTALFEGLMRFNAAGRPEPGCAQDAVVSADGLTWTFTLRDSARWSDGSPVTANDFVRSWQRLLKPTTAADYSSIFYTIAGAEAYNTGRLTDFSKVGVRAPSDRVLVISLANPVPYFRDLLAFMCYCPVHIDSVEKHGQAAWKPGTLISNGAYVLKEWRLNDRIRLEKNPYYWDARNVRMQTIDVLPTDNANTAINLFLTGGADLLIDKGLIPNAIAGALPDKPWFHHRPLLGTWFLRFNATRPPCNDARVRKALTMVIDRRRITEAVTRLGEQPVTTLTPPGTGDGYALPAGLPQNITEAQRLLAEAGFPGGRGFPVLNYLYPSKFPSDNGIAIELQSMWKESLGITVSLQRQEYKAYLESQKALAYDTSRSSWVGDYNDPNTFLDVFTSTNGNNWTGWKNPNYDRLIAAAASEPDAAARNRLLHDAETLLLSTECVIAPVYQFNGVQFYHPDKLAGLEANLIDEHPFRTLYWK